MTGRVAVALSGGVDSSAAAALLMEAGRQPFGLTMRLFTPQETSNGRAELPRHGAGAGRCCGGDDVEVARRAAGRLGIPFFVIDMEDLFRRRIVDDFILSYRAGRTPIPCATCNHVVKFDGLLRRARGMGADRLATGHYARLERDPKSGRRLLRRAVDAGKDQTYFLFGLSQAVLEQVAFPVGHLSKAEVREVARRCGLPNADKAESQDLCFVPEGDYRRFIRRESVRGGHQTEAGGEIVDVNGRVLGRHAGLTGFTVGQRHGLGVATGRRLYVLHIDAASGRVTVGERTETQCVRLEVASVNWVSHPRPGRPVDRLVQIRHRHRPVPARVEPLAGRRAAVIFRRPVEAAAPGQAAVFYDGDLLAGGGWIDAVDSRLASVA
ncbi:MAG: tRNA 2-thiouridine(34) synthase MnmA [Acidobacteriota bacterium]